MFLVILRLVVVDHPARSRTSTACAPFSTWRLTSSIWRCVSKGQTQSGPGAARRANRAKQIRTLVALIGRLAGSGCRALPIAVVGQLRDLIRKVQADCAIDLDTNSYPVPWRLIGESVQVVVLAGRVIIRHAARW
ncbi:MAG: hypothetical protein EOS36_27460 [Mesorhizobium sp.]|nr:MAG: hypothetical protein EOS36_27460 [Mesorhizobium sp.]RWE32507.1 MAG: hypothetical protein EOS79_30785 [Mesorhizobium sp.]